MNPSITRTVAGVGIILVGIVAMLSAFDVLNFQETARQWWPTIIIGAGLLMLVSNPRNFVWALIVVAAGIALLVRQLGFTDFNIFTLFWPIVLIVIGFSVLFNRSGAGQLKSEKSHDDITAILAGVESKNTSDDYVGGKATALLGGVSLDLRKATIRKEATLTVTSFWGGIEVKVPETWVVKTRVNAIMGGIEVKNGDDSGKKGAPVLYIVGDVIMAGVEVKRA